MWNSIIDSLIHHTYPRNRRLLLINKKNIPWNVGTVASADVPPAYFSCFRQPRHQSTLFRRTYVYDTWYVYINTRCLQQHGLGYYALFSPTGLFRQIYMMCRMYAYIVCVLARMDEGSDRIRYYGVLGARCQVYKALDWGRRYTSSPATD